MSCAAFTHFGSEFTLCRTPRGSKRQYSRNTTRTPPNPPSNPPPPPHSRLHLWIFQVPNTFPSFPPESGELPVCNPSQRVSDYGDWTGISFLLWMDGARADWFRSCFEHSGTVCLPSIQSCRVAAVAAVFHSSVFLLLFFIHIHSVNSSVCLEKKHQEILRNWWRANHPQSLIADVTRILSGLQLFFFLIANTRPLYLARIHGYISRRRLRFPNKVP